MYVIAFHKTEMPIMQDCLLCFSLMTVKEQVAMWVVYVVTRS